MAEYIDRETILDDLDIDIKVTNKERLLAKERHCVEDRMRYAKKLDHLRGFREYIKNLSTANVVEQEKIDKAIEEMNSMELGLIMECGEMRDYCVEILKRNIGE